MMDIGCVVYDMVYEWVSMHSIFNHSWIVEVSLALPGVVMYGYGSSVAGCSRWGDGTSCGMVWGWVGRGKRWDMSCHKPISIIINQTISNSIPRDVSLSGQPILAQPNFHTLYKSGQCSPKHKLISDFCESYDRWDIQLSIHIKVSRIVSLFFLADYSKCQLFFETLRIQMPWIGGSPLNHMMRNWPTTMQETFYDEYKTDIAWQ